MKTYRLGEPSIQSRFRRRAWEAVPKSPRECLVLGDPTDCLLDAYDCVAQRAYENYLAHGPRPGGELEDWLKAERQLLLNFPIDLAETDDFIYALASVPGATASRLSLGIESRWMVILVRAPQDEPRSTPPPAQSAKAARVPRRSRRKESQRAESRAPAPVPDERRAKSVCVMGLPCAVDAARSIAVLADGVLDIRMAKLRRNS
jgi:HSP20 family molecular chaperone IbpA